jgi:hypothetical protein
MPANGQARIGASSVGWTTGLPAQMHVAVASGNCQFCGSTAARAGICGPATFFVSRCSHSLVPSCGGPKGLRHTRRGLVALCQQLRGTTSPTHYARSQGEAAPFRTRSHASLQSRCKVHPIHRPCTTIRGTSLCWKCMGRRSAAPFRTERPDGRKPGIQGNRRLSTCSDRSGCTAAAATIHCT